jgi:hypothetical protein
MYDYIIRVKISIEFYIANTNIAKVHVVFHRRRQKPCRRRDLRSLPPPTTKPAAAAEPLPPPPTTKPASAAEPLPPPPQNTCRRRRTLSLPP